MKKLFSLVMFALLSIGSAWAADYPDDNYLLLNGSTNNSIATSQVTGNITFACNTSKYTYQALANSAVAYVADNEFKKGLKQEGATYTEFTTTELGTITIIGWNSTDYPFVPKLSVDGGSETVVTSWENLITKEYGATKTDGYQNVVIYKICNAAAGKYKITRGANQNWMLYVGVTYGETPSYTISTEMNNGGSSTVSGAGSYLEGATATLTATPKGKAFDHWELDGLNVSTDNPYSFTVSKDATYTAVFLDATTHAITGAIADGQDTWGSITNEGENSVVEDETITFEATANTGYAFVNWTKDGSEYSTEPSITITSTEANAGTYTANFKKLYVVTYDAGDGDFGTTDKINKIAYADAEGKVTLWSKNGYIGKEGYTLTGWNDGSNNYKLGDEITLTSDATMTAVFTQNSVSLDKSTKEVTITWNLNRASASDLEYEVNGTTGYMVVQGTINDEQIDFPMYITGSKFFNFGRVGNGTQINATTTLTIPAIKNMQITIATTSDGTGKTDYQISPEKSSIAGLTSFTKGTSATVTYTGDASTVDIVLGDGGYWSKVEVVYPKNATYVDVTSAGYRTFASGSALDFTGGVEGLTAYRAVVDGDNVSFVEIEGEVPAGEGMLIKADEGRYYIPLASGEPAEIENDFIGVTAKTEVDKGSFVLFKDDTHEIGFYKTTAEKFEVGANTAYLPATVSAARTFIALDGETTGVNAVESVEATDGKFFDLQGRQVSKPTKGLYISNGKKYIVK